jgi:hypothetical protein
MWGAVAKWIVTWLGGRMGARLAGGLAKAGAVGAIIGVIAWFFGAGREWTITLNALELAGAVLACSALFDWARRLPPPI